MRPFTYTKPTTAADAVRAIAAAGSGTRFLAGGTTLYDLMKLNIETPASIVDVTALPELRGFDTSGSSELVFGALARMSDVAADRAWCGLSGAVGVAVEGGVAAASQHGDPWRQSAAAHPLRLFSRRRAVRLQQAQAWQRLRGQERHRPRARPARRQRGLHRRLSRRLGGRSVRLRCQGGRPRAQGQSTIALEDLHREPGVTPDIETTLEPNELILRIRVPATPLGRASTYHKIRDRESFAFALASAAVALEMDGDTVRDARIAVGGLATRPWRAREAEQTLVGRPLTAQAARAAGDAALQGAKASDDNRFRIELGARTVADALMIAKQRALRQ